MGKACEEVLDTLGSSMEHAKTMRDTLKDGLLQIPRTRVNGDLEHCLPNTLSIGFEGILASELLSRLEPYLCASAGAACHSEGVSVSQVLQAMEVPLDYAKGTLRLSTGQYTTSEEIQEAIRLITKNVKDLRQD